MDKEDPEVLGDFMQKPNPLVTTDLAMVRQHLSFIPDFHPGILTIGNGKNPQTNEQEHQKNLHKNSRSSSRSGIRRSSGIP